MFLSCSWRRDGWVFFNVIIRLSTLVAYLHLLWPQRFYEVSTGFMSLCLCLEQGKLSASSGDREVLTASRRSWTRPVWSLELVDIVEIEALLTEKDIGLWAPWSHMMATTNSLST